MSIPTDPVGWTAPDPGCHFHGYEPIPDGAYQVCGECGHCYVTREELLREDAKIHREMGMAPPDPHAEVYVCPLCTHDF